MIKRIFIVSFGLGLILFSPLNGFSQRDGVYVSRPTTQQDIDATLSEYVRRVVINSVLDSSGKLIERIVRNQNVQIFPQMAGLSVQQTALQVFKQDELMDICNNAYDESLELLKSEREEGLSQPVIQEHVKQNVEKILNPIYEKPAYKHIVEEILKHTLKEQHRIMVLQSVQRQAQLMVVQQQINQMQQAALQAYLSGLTSQE